MATRRTGARGPRVAITREGAAAELVEMLDAAGGSIVATPLIRIAPPTAPEAFHDALARLSSFDWIVFTSANAVSAVAAGLPRQPLPRPRVAVVGPSTAAAVEELLGWAVDVMPPDFTGAALAGALAADQDLRGARVLWPRAEHARAATGAALRAAGAALEDPIAYRTLPDPVEARRLSSLVDAGEIDVIAFTAPAAVRCFAEVHRKPVPCLIGVIGASTAEEARGRGLRPAVESAENTMRGLLEAVLGVWRATGER